MDGSPVIIDASAIASILFNEPRGEVVWAAVGDRPLVAPTLLLYELANVAARKLRDYPEQHHLFEIVSLIDNLKIDYLNIPFSITVTLALQTGLSSYDAAYLWLSQESGAPLVTLDLKLISAARLLGIPTLTLE